MRTLNILDCTLRDGGCVNNFNFGQDYMGKILDSLEKAHVDTIECGYIDEKNGSATERTQFCDEQVIVENFLHEKKSGINYVAMIDYGKYDVNKLKPRTSSDIDGIRLAFHKKDRNNMIAWGRTIIEKGYKLYIQPMIVMRYSDKELLELIEEVNEKLPDAEAFYIVDSFGEMRANDMIRILNLVDHNLIPSMMLGFHSHNNLQLSYSNAITFLNFNTERNLTIDSSIMGMGKGAGNLNTELLAEHLNLYHEKNYMIQPLLEVIDTVINQIHAEFYWGYSVEYYLSSINHCTPSYAGHFYKKHMLSVDQVAELLKMIPEEKKISFDREFADQLYLEYNEKQQYNDGGALEELGQRLDGKEVILIAPGRHLTDADVQIREMLGDKKYVSVALNNYKLYDTDYVLATKQDIYEKGKKKGSRMIVTSNLCQTPDVETMVIDYRKWIKVEDGVNDAAVVIILNLLKALHVGKVYLAGFDGFSANINENYFDKELRRPVTDEQAKERNTFIRKFIEGMRSYMDIEFMTESLYNK